MRIQSIEITDYKAFLGTHKFKVGGKNLFVYGENGSGKSSLYYALKDFFQSSIEPINLAELRNIFVPSGEEGAAGIRVEFKPDSQGANRKKTYSWDESDNAAPDDTSIRDANKLKSFLTYRHLLGIHHISKGERINLFQLLVNGVLKHFKYSLTFGKELGELWADIERAISRNTGADYRISRKRSDVDNAVSLFNDAFGELFKSDSPEHILRHTRPILERFGHNIELELGFSPIRPDAEYKTLENAEVHVDLKYAGKQLTKPHLFLNEARLSAIAISIYLGMIKRHEQGIPCKVLFLDDIFIGLDIANRLPLLEILQNEFSDYQIFITTYDKPWFEHARGFFDGKKSWKTMELYAQRLKDGTEIPVIFDDQDLLKKAQRHLQQCDYKAAAIYTRSAFERMIRKHCEKKKKAVPFRLRLRDYTTEDFWRVIRSDLPDKTCEDIETYRPLVLNPFSHYNTEYHEINLELRKAVEAVENLRRELRKL